MRNRVLYLVYAARALKFKTPNLSRKKQMFNDIRDIYTHRGSVSGPCPANIDACTTPSGHASDCVVSKQL